MKYLKKFQTNSDYQTFKSSSEYVEPNISVIENDHTIFYEPIKPPTLITFTVNGVEYQAEEGMTWGEFVNSDYNPTINVLGTDFKEFTSSLLPNYVGRISVSGTYSYIVLNGVKVILNEQILEQEYSSQPIK